MSLGIFSIVLGAFSFGVVSVLAIILGVIGLRNIEASQGQLAGKKAAITGITFGVATSILWIGSAIYLRTRQ